MENRGIRVLWLRYYGLNPVQGPQELDQVVGLACQVTKSR